jgi:hypothetical protein
VIASPQNKEAKAMPHPQNVTTGKLAAAHLQWEAARAAIDAKLGVVEAAAIDNDPLHAEVARLERVILTKPCRSAGDAIAKIHQCIRGFDDGETGLEQDALRQVAAFLGAQ